MELLQLWRILNRRLWLVVIIAMLSALSWALFGARQESSYTATMRVLTTLPREQNSESFFRYDRYYVWTSSEYLADDLAEVVKSQAFRVDVAEEMGGGNLDGVSIQSVPRNERSGRIVTVQVTSEDFNLTRTASQAAALAIEKKANKYFSQLGSNETAVRVIDPPSIAQPSAPVRSLLNLGIRVILSLVAGIALVFLLHYVDNTFYDTLEVEESLSLPVIGEVPVEKRG